MCPSGLAGGLVPSTGKPAHPAPADSTIFFSGLRPTDWPTAASTPIEIADEQQDYWPHNMRASESSHDISTAISDHDFFLFRFFFSGFRQAKNDQKVSALIGFSFLAASD
jgi:hypothetical protein